MTKVLTDTIDFFVDGLAKPAFRDIPGRIRAAIKLLDKHALWTPRTADGKRASAALVAALTRDIYNLFGDANETRWFAKWDRACGKDCARVVVAFRLQKHRLVKELWTYSKHGLARPLPS